MTFEVEVGGRIRTVAIERTDRTGRFRVTVDGTAHVLDVARVGEYGLSLLATVPFSDDNRPKRGTVDLQIAPGLVRGELLVNLEGRTTAVSLNGHRKRQGDAAVASGDGDVSVVAPMPGRVVRVLVAAGDDVGPRQGVVVVEAMKMENELCAPRAGRVKEVRVAPGMSVEAGHVLAVIE
jgi:biotin carboxyl carrier protein